MDDNYNRASKLLAAIERLLQIVDSQKQVIDGLAGEGVVFIGTNHVEEIRAYAKEERRALADEFNQFYEKNESLF